MKNFVSNNGNSYHFETENNRECIVHYIFKNNAFTPCSEIREYQETYDLFTYQKDLLTEEIKKYAYATGHEWLSKIINILKEM